MKKTIACTIGLLMMACSTSAFALERMGALTLTPFVGGYTFEGPEHIRSQPIYGLRMGVDLTRSFVTEAVVSYVNTEKTNQDLDIDAYSYHLDLLYNLTPWRSLNPYVVIGGGARTLDTDRGDDTSALFNAGLGVKYFLTDSMALRGDVRHVAVFTPDTMNNLEYTVGLTFLLGGAR